MPRSGNSSHSPVATLFIFLYFLSSVCNGSRYYSEYPDHGRLIFHQVTTLPHMVPLFECKDEYLMAQHLCGTSLSFVLGSQSGQWACTGKNTYSFLSSNEHRFGHFLFLYFAFKIIKIYHHIILSQSRTV